MSDVIPLDDSFSYAVVGMCLYCSRPDVINPPQHATALELEPPHLKLFCLYIYQKLFGLSYVQHSGILLLKL